MTKWRKIPVSAIILILSLLAAFEVVPHVSTLQSQNHWWNNEWKYKKEITISELSGKELINYQLPLALDTTTLTSQGKMKPNYSDLRFTFYNTAYGIEHEIPYYVEEGDSQNARVWIRVPYVPASGISTVCVYYGNLDAESVSNSELVFDLFDSFEYADDVAKHGWTAVTYPLGYNVSPGSLGTSDLRKIRGSRSLRLYDADSSAGWIPVKSAITPTSPTGSLRLTFWGYSEIGGVGSSTDWNEPGWYLVDQQGNWILGFQWGEHYDFGIWTNFAHNWEYLTSWYTWNLQEWYKHEALIDYGTQMVNFTYFKSDGEVIISSSFPIDPATIAGLEIRTTYPEKHYDVYTDELILREYAETEPSVTLGQEMQSEISGFSFWTQWWFWTNIALGATTAFFAVTTAHYRKKAIVSRETKTTSIKQTSTDYKACPNCGAKLPNDSAFCGKCGTRLE